MNRWLTVVLAILLGVSAAHADTQKTVVTVMTHNSFSMPKELVADFETRHGITLRFLKAGDAGAALNQAILSKDHPMADVFFGVDNSLMGRGLEAGIFIPYESLHLSDIPESLRLDPKHRLLPVDYGDVCLNYDRKWFQNHSLAPPRSIDDLTLPAYAGLCVVQHPASSSPGMAFLLATIGRYGDQGFIDYWKKLRENKVLIVDGWKEAYWGHFSAASKGNRPIVVSYATSPAAEVHFSKTPVTEPPTGAVVTAGNAFRQIECVGILAGTPHLDAAKKVVDFFLDLPFQESIPLQMFMFPARSSAKLPEVFAKHAVLAEKPVIVFWETIEANRERWLNRWADVALR